MTGSSKRGGDRVLESRHLVSLFLGVVLLCGVFFTLGYVMGHNQYGGPVHASESADADQPVSRPTSKPKAEQAPAATPAPANNEWDFYSKKNADDTVNSMSKPAASPSASVAARPVNPASPAIAPNAAAKSVPTAARFQAPKLNKGALVLQVAAVTHESDAMAMADVLQQKHFPSFVVTPTNDNFYRVQVGPYPDVQAADAAKQALDHAGFIAIIKR
ncbi:MAG TPA: SPOR domain-containing protein [Candidatus Acidoferrales bacterium]|nr:SPOR domain-containing protein [Candidatus Acidoferrales bacterium]